MVIVIGAGIVGLNIAWRLAEDGAPVIIFDPRPGQGATYAAAGMLAPVSEYWFQEEPLLEFARHAAQSYPSEAAKLHIHTGVDLHHRQDGIIVAAATRADRETLSRLQQAQMRHGLSVEQMTTRDVRKREPALAPRLAGAFISNTDRALDPRALADAYHQALTAHPHVTMHYTRVETLLHRGDRVVGVQDASGTEVLADTVVLANGLDANQLAGLPADWQPRLRPVYGETLRLQIPATATGTAPIIGPDHVVRALVEDRSVYVVPRGDGRYVVGATERENQPDTPAGAVYRLLRDAHQVVPDVLEMHLTEIVARARPTTPDHLPLLGDISPGLLAATGTYRHGVLLAPAIAHTISSLLQDKPAPVPIDAFDPWRTAVHDSSTSTQQPVLTRKEDLHGDTERQIVIDHS